MMLKTVLLAATIAISGCTTLADYGPVSKNELKDGQGHVIGYKQILRNDRTGEIVAQVALFSPILGDSGAIVAYEERARGGAVTSTGAASGDIFRIHAARALPSSCAPAGSTRPWKPKTLHGRAAKRQA
jgi:hypothetical protein